MRPATALPCPRRANSRVLGALTLCCLLLLTACSSPTLREDAAVREKTYAMEPTAHGVLWTVADDIMRQHGPEHSGFMLLDSSRDALDYRLALIDSAVSSLDIQTYLWYPDNSGRLVLERAILAARRGVKVRLIVDDLLTTGQDQLLYELQREKNIEFRLFNPWTKRGTLARAGQMIARMERLNSRMHDKLLIADGNAAIVGGRNIGDHYFGLAESELLITNACIIPAQRGIDFLQGLVARGVNVRILTNSLASHDVPAVNSHYKDWRDDFILAGAELYELRADAEIQSIVDVPPVEGGFVGLHTKAFVVDRQYAFIGSMNFDPRSANINTEAGAFIHSPGLAEELAQVMERDMSPENAWRVLLDEEGKVYWINSDERLDRQPARDGNQRVMDTIFRMFPKEQF
jgi:phosphatidylserine/phosphatidylglycerophosphate/cardiolipin synthase-like enzyme